MVHRASFHDCLQWCDGVHVWLLLWQDATHKIESQENMGRIYWWWFGHCSLWSSLLVLFVSISIFCVSRRILGKCWKNCDGMWDKLFVQIARIHGLYCEFPSLKFFFTIFNEFFNVLILENLEYQQNLFNLSIRLSFLAIEHF